MYVLVKWILIWTRLLQNSEWGNKTAMKLDYKRLLTFPVILIEFLFFGGLVFSYSDQISGKFLCLCVVQNIRNGFVCTD